MNAQSLVLLDLLAKGTAVLLLGFGCVSVMRRSSAAHRSLTWLAVFAAMLLLPLAIFVRPIWTVDVMVVRAQAKMETAPLVLSATAATDASAVAPVPQVIGVSAAWLVSEWLAVIYVVGGLGVVAFRLIGAWQLWGLEGRMGRKGQKRDVRVCEMVGGLCRRYGIARGIRVLQSDRVSVPMTWGVFKPVLMLPSACCEWSDEDLRAALEHELAHIRHGDAARRWLATFVCALWWPLPLVWMAAKAWRLEQERACDDAALCSGASAERYAGQLLDAARSARLGGFQSAAALVMAMPSGLETRLRAVVGEDVNRSAAGHRARLTSAAMALTVVTICAVCQAQNVAAPASEERFVRVAMKFIDISTKNSGKLPQMIETMTDGGKVLSADEATELVRQLSQKKGVDLMSTPTVVTKSGHQVLVETVREFSFPTALKEDGLNPAKFETLPIGVMLDVTPTFTADGRIDLDLAPLIREFEGFSVPSQPKKVFREEEYLKQEKRKGDLPSAVYTERKWQGRVPLKAGGWFAHDLVLTQESAAALTEDSPQKQRRILFLVTAEEVKADKAQPAAPAAPQEKSILLLQKAKRIVLPHVEFNHASLGEAVAFLRAKSLELDPEKEGVNIILKPGTSATGEITLNLRDVPLNEALRYVTELSMARLTYEPFAVVISPMAAGGRGDEMFTRVYRVPPTLMGTEKDAKKWLNMQGCLLHEGTSAVFNPETSQLIVKAAEPDLDKVEAVIEKLGVKPKTPEPPTPDIVKRAQAMILPQVVFKEATLAEAVAFLQAKSRQLAADKGGVNIVLSDAASKSNAKLSLNLKDLPLWEALHYVAELAGMRLEAGDSAIVIKPADVAAVKK